MFRIYRVLGAGLLLSALLGMGLARAATAPRTYPAAISGLGRLALPVSGGIEIVDGISHRSVYIRVRGTPTGLTWSRDGRWLAFLDAGLGGTGPIELVQSDGRDLHTVKGAAGQAVATAPLPSFAWLPRRDELAVASARTGLWIVPARGEPRQLALSGTHLQTLAVSPTGSEIAAVVTLPYVNVLNRRDEILLVSAASGRTREAYLAPTADGVYLASFWPDGQGLLFWIDPLHSASLAADGLGLFSLPLSGVKPRFLATTLTYPAWLSFAPTGTEVAIIAGGERIAWAQKRLIVCDLGTAACKPVATPQGITPMDPVWYVGGIALIGARPMPRTWGFSSGASLSAWVASRALWVLPSTGHGALTRATGGVYSPTLTGGGRLLYVLYGRIWTASIAGGPATAVTGGIPGLEGGFGFYGEMWPDYAFWSAHAS